MTLPMPLAVGASAMYPDNPGLRKLMTVVPRYGEPIQNFRVSGTTLHIPRSVAPLGGKDLREDGMDVKFVSRFKPRNSDQQRVVNESTNLLRNGRNHIMCCATGFGKTVMAIATMCNLGKRTLVIVTKQDLVDQWVKELMKFTDLTEKDIGTWAANKIPDPSAKVVVGLIQSVSKGPKRYGVNAYRGFGLAIFDETHRLGATEFKNCMWYLPAKHRLGLSATPNRADGADAVFMNHIGPVMVEGTVDALPFDVVSVRTNWQVPPNKWGPGKMPHEPGKCMHIVKEMEKHQQRNAIVGAFAAKAVEAGRRTIVFGDTMGMLEQFERYIVSAGVSPSDIGWYVGLNQPCYSGKPADQKQQRESAKKCKVILATYKMASEATDIPPLDTCVLGSPKANVVQIIGRIRRVFEGKKKPLVLDIQDMDSKVFAMYAHKRLRWYDQMNARVIQK